MKDRLNQLLELKRRFQPYLHDQELMYTYIAPKEKEFYDIFFKIAADQPTWSASMYEVLGNDKLICELLLEHFPPHTLLEIYVASDDSDNGIMINGTLAEYIKSENINFNY